VNKYLQYLLLGLGVLAFGCLVLAAGYKPLPDPLVGAKVWLPEYPEIKMTVKRIDDFEPGPRWVAESKEVVERKGGPYSGDLSGILSIGFLPTKKFLLEEKDDAKLYLLPMYASWQMSFGGEYTYMGLFSQKGEGPMHYINGVYVGNYIYVESLKKKDGGVLVTYWNTLSSDDLKVAKNRFDAAHQPSIKGTGGEVMLYWDGDYLHK
jgi:hypothetical protein